MTEQSELQIFLSYASPDQERVLPIYEFLIKNGYPNAWIDCKKLLPGQPWEYEITRNLRKSDIVLVFLSQRSVSKRGVVQKELKMALSFLEEKLQSDIYIIPIKLDSDVEVPPALSHVQWLDMNKPNSFEQLKQALNKQSEDLGFQPSSIEHEIDKIHVTKKIHKEKWEGLPGYEVEYSLPMMHSTEFPDIGEISKMIEGRFLSSLHFHRRAKIEQMPDFFSWAQMSYQRTNTYDAHYSTIFQSNTFLSIIYTVSWYGAGAAHPNHHIETFNYMLNPQFEIAEIQDLFTDAAVFFPKLQEYVQQHLLNIPGEDDMMETYGRDNLLDAEWVKNGTEDWSAFQAFSFSDEGLVVYFSPYQVGPYALGILDVTVPYKFLCDSLKNDFKHALDIHYLCV